MKTKAHASPGPANGQRLRQWLPKISPLRPLSRTVLVVPLWMFGYSTLNSAPAPEWTDQEIRQFTPAGLTVDKIGQFVDETDGDTDVSLKWNRFAIFDPKTALDAREKQKTPEHKERERLAIQAITQAPEFLRAKQEEESRKNAKQKAQDDEARQRARLAIERPLAAAKDAEKTKDTATKRREQIAAEAILNPREFNARVDQQMSAELKAREAEAIRAFTQPKEFMAERLLVKKNGGKKEIERPTGPPRERPQGVKEKGQVNAAGGGR